MIRQGVFKEQGSDNYVSKAEVFKLTICDIETQDMALIISIATLDSTHGITAGRDIYIRS